ncbi:TonB-linked outer membrane protein, SusC/RagA family [Prevotellaceae bacterium MN60]|nr:TonB-linked outer membrane protein, SusC/RagA family [Prevotellaceae bacterium MN60]
MFLTCLFMSLGMVYAQQKITGTVFEDNGEPCIGATVMIQGTKLGTKTDLDGNFSINVQEGKKLVISYVGMITQTVKAKDGMKITLQPDATQLQEVVAVGMMKQDKRLFTGASSKIDADKAKLAGMADVSRSLEGRVAGVQVTNVSGTFGASPKIRVRGATSIYGNSKPLWVIDGVIYEDNVDVSADELASGDAKTLISSAVAGLNSDDIESFTVLKDGSATSIYGARAMAGVIVITTKKGSKGRASVNYTGEFTTRLKPSYRDYNIMNSQEIMGVYKEMANKGWLSLESLANAEDTGVYGYMYQQLRKFDPTTGTFGLENTEAARNKYLQAAEFRNTDWFDLLFSNSIQQNHSVSVAGGTDRSQSYFSMSLMNDPGQYVSASKVRRYTFNGNTSYEILKNLTAKLAAQGSFRNQEAPGSLNQSVDVVTGEVKRDFDINPFSFAMNTSRCLDPNINYTRFYSPFNIFDELQNNYNDIDVKELMFRAELEYKPIKTVTLTGLISTRLSSTRRQHNVMDGSNQANAYRAGVNQQDDNSTIRNSNPLLYTNPDDELALPEAILPEGGIKYEYSDKMRSNNYRFMAEYRDVYNEKHVVNALFGSELSTVRRTPTTWTGWGYQFNNGGIVYTPYLWLKQRNEENTDYFSESFTQTNTLAYYAQAVYSYDQRYTINGTFRYEGTNRLGKERSSRWLPTWNISGSYDITNEPFMKNTENWLSQLKLRASYSLTADTGPSYVTNARAIYKTKNTWRPYTSAAESQIYISDLANSQLTYEKKHEFNIGVDLGFLRDRIAINFDAYWRNNYDLIGATFTQGCGGQIQKMANVADMESHGLEVGISTVNVQTPKFKWTSDLIYSLAKNEITTLQTSSRAVDLVSGQGYALEGYPVRSIFSYKFAGLNNEGLPMVYNEKGIKTVGDVNFQETENLEDFLIYEGPSDPTWYGSFNNSFSFNDSKLGKLNLDVFITYSGGNVVRLDPVFSYAYSDLSALPREFKNRWMMSGDENVTNIPVIASRNQVDRYGSNALRTAYNAYNYSEARIAKGNFVRLKEISVTYTFPQGLLKSTKLLSTASIKLSATNLCLLYADKKLNGQDPEFINAGGVASPITKQFTATVRLGF